MALPPASPVVLTGERVELSAPVESDIDRIAALCRDPEVARWTTVPVPYERDDAERFVLQTVADGWISGRSCTWAIRRRRPMPGSPALIGMVSIDRIHDAEAEIGYWLAPEARGQGLMTESVALVTGFAFQAPPSGLGLQRLVWHAVAGNAASAAVARRTGFRFEGVRRLGALHRERRLDDWQAALLVSDPRVPADDWPALTTIQADEAER